MIEIRVNVFSGDSRKEEKGERVEAYKEEGRI
jgi:hypothetical protein